MKIESLKDLQKLIQLCRKTGVEAITVDGIELKLGAQAITYKTVPKTKKSIKEVLTELEEPTIDMPDELSPEQLLFYSAQGYEPPVEG